MKRLIPLILALVLSTAASAQLIKPKEKVTSEYGAGTVTMENNRVVFRSTIEAPGLSSDEIKQRVQDWYNNRYVEPTVISSEQIDNGSSNSVEAKAEEYIVFKKKLLVLSRTRINYFITATAYDGRCDVALSRISYWYDDEDPDGGLRYKAEELITDENALDKNRTVLKKFPGKFRKKTIDFKNTLFGEIEKALTDK